eukprot:2423469-Pyramimonas_sp.AAC.2
MTAALRNTPTAPASRTALALTSTLMAAAVMAVRNNVMTKQNTHTERMSECALAHVDHAHTANERRKAHTPTHLSLTFAMVYARRRRCRIVAAARNDVSSGGREGEGSVAAGCGRVTLPCLQCGAVVRHRVALLRIPGHIWSVC